MASWRNQWRSRGQAKRLWAHVYLHQWHPDFDLVPSLIGYQGEHMKRVNLATTAKVRIRGKGSGHLEVAGRWEAPVPLMLAVSTDSCAVNRFRAAIEMIIALVARTALLYKTFCAERLLPPELGAQRLFSFGEFSNEAAALIGDLAALYPPPDFMAELALRTASEAGWQGLPWHHYGPASASFRWPGPAEQVGSAAWQHWDGVGQFPYVETSAGEVVAESWSLGVQEQESSVDGQESAEEDIGQEPAVDGNEWNAYNEQIAAAVASFLHGDSADLDAAE